MDYKKDILNRLIDIYERREAYAKDASSLRAIQIDLQKIYKVYTDRYNHEGYKEINIAIEELRREDLVLAESNSGGMYSKVKLNIDRVELIYKRIKRDTIPDQCKRIKESLIPYRDCGFPLLQAVTEDWLALAEQYKKLPYDLKYNSLRTGEVLEVLQAILKLRGETYIRNFSTALFKDSKRFQKEFRSVIESILFDYTEEVVEKNGILGLYNLYENPTYVLIKGDALIRFASSVIEVVEMPDGIALSNASLDQIESITLKAGRVITVENLTSFHDSDEEDAVHIYLGGYHNHSKQILLEKIYAENKSKAYYHKGDLDVYGFLILENLKEKTQIPFQPLMMDVADLESFYHAGLYKKLTAGDRRVIEEQKRTKLQPYRDVLQFMLDHDCKVEQESMKAVGLFSEKR